MPTDDYRPVSDDEVLRCGDDVDCLAPLYAEDAVTVARVCDELIDRSGALLGRVRLHVKDSGWKPGYR